MSRSVEILYVLTSVAVTLEMEIVHIVHWSKLTNESSVNKLILGSLVYVNHVLLLLQSFLIHMWSMWSYHCYTINTGLPRSLWNFRGEMVRAKGKNHCTAVSIQVEGLNGLKTFMASNVDQVNRCLWRVTLASVGVRKHCFDILYIRRTIYTECTVDYLS